MLNPAAYTAVDKAEGDEVTAQAVNAIAPGIIGEEAAKIGALVIHYSTDLPASARNCELWPTSLALPPEPRSSLM